MTATTGRPTPTTTTARLQSFSMPDVGEGLTEAEVLSWHVAVGDTLTIPVTGGVRVIEIAALPLRRGLAAEAMACYRALDREGHPDIAAGPEHPREEGLPQ